MHQSEQTPERRYGLYARSVAQAMPLGMADYRTYIRGDDGHFQKSIGESMRKLSIPLGQVQASAF